MTLPFSIAILSILTYSTFIDANDEHQLSGLRDISYLDLVSTKDLTSLKYQLAIEVDDNATILIGSIYMINQKETVCQMKIFPECIIGAEKKTETLYMCDHAGMSGFPPRNRLIFIAEKQVLSKIYDAGIFLPLIFSMCNVERDFTKQTRPKCEAMKEIYEARGKCWNPFEFRNAHASECGASSKASIATTTEKIKPYAFVHFWFFVLLFGFLSIALYRRHLFSHSGKFYV